MEYNEEKKITPPCAGGFGHVFNSLGKCIHCGALEGAQNPLSISIDVSPPIMDADTLKSMTQVRMKVSRENMMDFQALHGERALAEKIGDLILKAMNARPTLRV